MTAVTSDTLASLVGFETVSDRSNLALIEYIEARLAKRGADLQRLGVAGEKANLVGRLGPDAPGGVMLAGHTDVVPAAHRAWQTDPFTLTRTGDRLIGRGTADMLGALALVLDAVDATDLGDLARPLWLAFTYDEEVGCGGAQRLAAELRGWRHKPEFTLIGEPTEGRVVVAHKGLCIQRSQITGRAAHASRPDLGANAILGAALLLRRIEASLPDTLDESFDPPRSTFGAGVIEGGTATNVVAARCVLQWELRPLPTVPEASLDAMLEGLGDLGEGLDVEHEVIARVPAMAAGANREAADRVGTILGDARRETRPYVTEGGIYQAAGIPAVICGPGHSSRRRRRGRRPWHEKARARRGGAEGRRRRRRAGAVRARRRHGPCARGRRGPEWRPWSRTVSVRRSRRLWWGAGARQRAARSSREGD
jgi:acetylornithine deacetylase